MYKNTLEYLSCEAYDDSNFQIFPKRNFVKLSFLKFFEIFSLSSKHASVKRFLSLTLKITLIEKYLPITMQPPEVF